MTVIIRKPDLEIIADIFSSSISIEVVTPFYSKRGLGILENAINYEGISSYSFWCQPLNLESWIQGYSSPETLLEIIDRMIEHDVEYELMTSSNLHAKIYIGDDIGAFGSSNLTIDGFLGNLEIIGIVRNESLERLKNYKTNVIGPNMENLTIESLRDFVNSHQAEVIEEIRNRRRSRVEIIEETGVIEIDQIPSFNDFISYLETLNTTESNYVIDCSIRRRNNLSGHYRAFYYASQLFFNRNPGMVELIYNEGPIYSLITSDQRDDWIDFMRSNDLEDISHFGYTRDNIRNYLGTNLGGVQTTGTGGSGNLNRCLYFVARYILFLRGELEN